MDGWVVLDMNVTDRKRKVGVKGKRFFFFFFQLACIGSSWPARLDVIK